MNANRKRAITGSIVATIAAAAIWATSRQTAYTYYFPYSPIDSCTPREDFGIAWRSRKVPNHQALCARYWYNWGAYKVMDTDDTAIPFVRPGNLDDSKAYIPADYTGWLLVANEPEGESQDNLTPAEAVDFFRDVHDAYPDAFVVGLNTTSDEFTDDFLTIWNEAFRPFDAIGIHVYAGGLSPAERVATVCDILDDHDLLPCAIWITEIGYSNNAAAGHDIMRDWLTEAGDDDWVKKIFAYTAGFGCCAGRHDMIVDGQLTAVGRAFAGYP